MVTHHRALFPFEVALTRETVKKIPTTQSGRFLLISNFPIHIESSPPLSPSRLKYPNAFALPNPRATWTYSSSSVDPSFQASWKRFRIPMSSSIDMASTVLRGQANLITGGPCLPSRPGQEAGHLYPPSPRLGCPWMSSKRAFICLS